MNKTILLDNKEFELNRHLIHVFYIKDLKNKSLKEQFRSVFGKIADLSDSLNITEESIKKEFDKAIQKKEFNPDDPDLIIFEGRNSEYLRSLIELRQKKGVGAYIPALVKFDFDLIYPLMSEKEKSDFYELIKKCRTKNIFIYITCSEDLILNNKDFYLENIMSCMNGLI